MIDKAVKFLGIFFLRTSIVCVKSLKTDNTNDISFSREWVLVKQSLMSMCRNTVPFTELC